MKHDSGASEAVVVNLVSFFNQILVTQARKPDRSQLRARAANPLRKPKARALFGTKHHSNGPPTHVQLLSYVLCALIATSLFAAANSLQAQSTPRKISI